MPDEKTPEAASRNHLVLYDGVCCLCNRLIRFVIRRDQAQVFRFAPLQSGLGQSLLRQHAKAPGAQDTVVVIAGYDSRSPTVLFKARAALFVLRTLGGPWRIASVFRILPDRLLDWLYDLVARHRYRIFGRYETCPIPTAEQRSRFLG